MADRDRGTDTLRMPRPPLPDRTRVALSRAGVVLVAWTAIGLVLAQQTAMQLRLRDQVRPAWEVFAPSLVYAWTWALYTPLVFATTRRLRPLRERGVPGWVAWLAAHAVLAAVLTIAGTMLYAQLRTWIDGVPLDWRRVLATGLAIDLASYVGVVTLVEASDYAALYRDRDRAAATLARTAAELQARLDEARMHALEAQLRPHFLFNTLNLIAELVHEAPETADAMLTRLGHLLRRAYQATAHVVPLAEELDFVVAYAEILTCRYGERATLRVDVPAAARGLQVPAFALQPLVENAFRHGVERREGATVIDLTAVVRAGQLVLRVRDRGTGAPPRDRGDGDGLLDTASLGGRTGSGVGLRNTRERLAALHGDAAGLALVQAQDTTVATLWLPALPAAPEPREESATAIAPRASAPPALARSGERR